MRIGLVEGNYVFVFLKSLPYLVLKQVGFRNLSVGKNMADGNGPLI